MDSEVQAAKEELAAAIHAERGGIKNDQGKPQMSLLPPRALRAVAYVMTRGCEGREPWDWLNVQPPSRYVDALMRHLNAWRAGEDDDPETSMSHLAHLAADALILLERELRGESTRDPRSVPQDGE